MMMMIKVNEINSYILSSWSGGDLMVKLTVTVVVHALLAESVSEHSKSNST